MENNDSKVSLPDAMTELYRDIDAHAEKMAKGVNASCTKGCHSCCHLLAMASPIDGLNIAYHLVQKNTTKELLEIIKKLVHAAKQADFEGLDNGTYFRKKIRCAFLSEEGVCTIYPVRPASCRLHFVISPPENCSPDAKEGKTKILDFYQMELAVLRLTKDVFGKVTAAPIAITVLEALRMVLQDAAENEEEAQMIEFLNEQSKQVLSIDKWLEKHALNVHRSTVNGITGRYRTELPK